VDRCALFVDAGYVLADGAMAVHGTRRRESVTWDYPGLLQLLASLATERSRLPLLRCYWYEATVEGKRSADHDALADLPGVKLRVAKMRPGRREGVEGEIHRDLTTLARNKAVSDAMIVSAEEDLAPVIADVQDMGMRVTLLNIAVDGNWTLSRALRQECDDIVEISAAHLRPYVELISGAEPPRPDEQEGVLLGLRSASNAVNGNGHAPALRVPAYAKPPRPLQANPVQANPVQARPAAAEYQSQPPLVGRPRFDEPAAREDVQPSEAPAGRDQGVQRGQQERPENGVAADYAQNLDYGTVPEYAPAPDYGTAPDYAAVPDYGPGQDYGAADYGPVPDYVAPSAGVGAGAAVGASDPFLRQDTRPFPGRAEIAPRPDGQPLPDPAPMPVNAAVTGPVAAVADDVAARPRQEADFSAYNPGAVREQHQRDGMLRDPAAADDRLQQVPTALPAASAQVRRLPTRSLPPSAPAPAQPPAGMPSTSGPMPGLTALSGAQGTLADGANGANGQQGHLGQAPSGQQIAQVVPMDANGAGYAGGPRNGSYGGPRSLPGIGGPVVPSGSNGPAGPGAPGPGVPGSPVSGPFPGQQLLGAPVGSVNVGPANGVAGQQNGPVSGGQPTLSQVPQGTPMPPAPSPLPQEPGAPSGPIGLVAPGGYPAGQPGVSLADAVQSAHKEGQEFGDSVARDAPALWLEAVLARKPRMPSDLEARLLQGSALPIDFLLHDEVRHALRRGFWDALERARR
jgi:hypothetical protein